METVIETPGEKKYSPKPKHYTRHGKYVDDPRPDPGLAATTSCFRSSIRLRWLWRWQISTALLLTELAFQVGDVFRGVVLVHQQIVPSRKPPRTKLAGARQYERSATRR
jgi:hypothetical protein